VLVMLAFFTSLRRRPLPSTYTLNFWFKLDISCFTLDYWLELEMLY
jgi:hypothetical protein